MKAEYKTVCAEVEGLLATSRIHLPFSWMVNLILSYAESGQIDPDELQDLVRMVCSGLDNLLEKDSQRS